MKLEKKLALVTGGARGIGKTICKNFLDEGASVAIFDVNEEVGKETAESVWPAGSRAHWNGQVL